MAALALDLRETNDDSFSDKSAAKDEVDAARSLEVVRDSDVPLKYFRNKVFSGVQERYERISERPQKHRLVLPSWGQKLSDLADTFGPFGLITFEEKIPIEHKAGKIAHEIISHLSEHRVKPFRWSGQYLLLWFADKHGYNAMGSRFLNGDLDRSGLKIVKIEPALVANPSKCFIEIEAASCEKHFNCLMPPLLPFTGAFTFARLRESENGKANGDSQGERPKKQAKIELETPALCLTLMFIGHNQSQAARSLQCFSGLGWQPLVLPGPVAKALDDGLHYFVHESLNLPLVGVRTGASQPGVQLTLFVQNSQKFTEMERFYKQLLGVEAYERHIPDGVGKYSVFPVSRQGEFVLAYYHDLKVSSLKNAVIYIQVKNIENVQGIIKICSSYWHTNDPEGNRVVVYQPLQ